MKQLFLSVSQSHVSISIKLYLAVFCSKLVEIYLLNCEQVVSEKLMAGFVECLDNEEAEEGVENIGGEALSVSLTVCVCVCVHANHFYVSTMFWHSVAKYHFLLFKYGIRLT